MYGYSVPLKEVTQEVVKYLERTAHYKASVDLLGRWDEWFVLCVRPPPVANDDDASGEEQEERRAWRLTPSSSALTRSQIEPEWIVWSHGLVPALTVASRMAGGEGDSVMVRASSGGGFPHPV